MVELRILRNKWCEDLEDILQCPICMMCPTNTYFYQCTQGHHICHVCQTRLRKPCPTCGSEWSSFRNRLAENMCSKFEDIKISLIDPEAEINKLLISDKICAGTQTDTVEGADIEVVGAAVKVVGAAIKTVVTPPSPPPPAQRPALNHSGQYPCGIDSCRANLYFEPFMEHIQKMHPFHFIELPVGTDLLFKHTWEFDYTANCKFERVIRILDVGTFILKISTDIRGDLCGYVMMIHSPVVSKSFLCRLELSSGSGYALPTFTGNVTSCRSPATFFEKHCLKVKRFDMVMAMNERSTMFECTLFLARNLQLDFRFIEAQPPRANGRNRRRAKNRNKIAQTEATDNVTEAKPGA